VSQDALRSLLFVPGHRDSMLAKASALGADAIVLDLEDSVPPNEKAAARERVGRTLAAWPDDGPSVFVRINAPRMGHVQDDIAAVAARPEIGIVVPKVDRPVELSAVFDALAALGGRERGLIVNVETPRAVLHVEEFADAWGVDGIFLGGEDLTNALGARRTPESAELAWPRYLLLLAARAAGIAAYDSICPEFRDLDVLARDCRVAADTGFDGKFAIHPAQIPIIHAAFTPASDDIERAQRFVDAYDAAVTQGQGAVAVDGQMIDAPVAERARALLRRAERATPLVSRRD
jgi:citrate lyase subunit beta/citryl-CoA lyase